MSMRENTRQQWDREEDGMPTLARVLYKYGVPSAIAIFLVWLITTKVLAGIDDIKTMTNQHNMTTSFYLRQMCITMNENAGRSSAVCEPPSR